MNINYMHELIKLIFKPYIIWYISIINNKILEIIIAIWTRRISSILLYLQGVSNSKNYTTSDSQNVMYMPNSLVNSEETEEHENECEESDDLLNNGSEIMETSSLNQVHIVAVLLNRTFTEICSFNSFMQ